MKRQRVHLRGAAVLGASVGVVLVAAGIGFATTVGVALITTRPIFFLAVGLSAVFLVAAVGFCFVLHRLSRPRRAGVTLAGAGMLLVVSCVAVLAPLSDPHAGAAPVQESASWRLSTGSTIAYLQLTGTSPRRSTPIVALHGGPGIPFSPDDVVFFGRLTDLGFSVYIYDQLGAGRSTRLDDPTGYSIDRDVADLEQIRRSIGADQLVLIGHSYGATLAAHYLAAYPNRVEKLILSSPGSLDPQDHSGDRATAGLSTADRLGGYAAALAPRALLGYTLLQVNPAAAHAYLGDPELDARNDSILTITEPALHCSPEQGTGQVRGSGFYALQYPQSATAPPQPDVRPALSGLRTPTLIFKGACDYLSWHSVMEYRRLLPTTLLYLPNAGHSTYQDEPSVVLAAMRAFLSDQPLPQSPYTSPNPPEGYRGAP